MRTFSKKRFCPERVGGWDLEKWKCPRTVILNDRLIDLATSTCAPYSALMNRLSQSQYRTSQIKWRVRPARQRHSSVGTITKVQSRSKYPLRYLWTAAHTSLKTHVCVLGNWKIGILQNDRYSINPEFALAQVRKRRIGRCGTLQMYVPLWAQAKTRFHFFVEPLDAAIDLMSNKKNAE